MAHMLLLVLGLLFTGSSTAWAQKLEVLRAEIGIRAEVHGDERPFPHGGVEGMGCWLPCEIVVRNPGAVEFRGTLSVEEVRAAYRLKGLQVTRMSHPLTLGPGAQKRIVFPILYHPAHDYVLGFDDDELGSIEVQHLGGNAKARVPVLRPLARAPAESLVLYVRPEGDVPPALDRLQVLPSHFGGPALGISREWILLRTNPEALPRHPVLYHRVGAVLLDDVSLDGLETEQRHALLAFVAGGGSLWVSMLKRRVGPQSPFAEFLPGVPAKTKDLDLLPALSSYGNRAALSRSVLTFTPKRGSVVWGREQTVLHRRHGRGWVVQAGFRIGDALAADQIGLLRDVLLVRERELLPVPSTLADRLLKSQNNALRSSTRKAVPPLSSIVLLLILYALGAIVVPFVVGKRAGRLEFAWIGVALAALLGGAAVLGLGKRYELTNQVVRVTFVSGGAERGPLRQTSLWAVFSQNGGDLVLELTRDATALGNSGNVRSIAPRRVTLATYPQDTTLLTTVETVHHPGGLRFDVTGRDEGRLSNDGPLRVLGAWAYTTKGTEFGRLESPSGSRGDDVDVRLQPALQAARQHTRQLAAQLRRPILLYRFAGGEALSQLPETTLRLGLLAGEVEESRTWIPAPTRPTRLPAHPDTDQWSFAAVLPTRTEVSTVKVLMRRRYGGLRRGLGGQRRVGGGPVDPEHLIFDWKSRAWRKVQDGARMRNTLVTTSPLGVARGLIRAPASHVADPQVSLDLTSLQERE